MSNLNEPSSSSSFCTTLVDISSPSKIVYSTSIIKRSLKDDQIHFQVLSNNNKRSKAMCWKTFGFPAICSNENLKKFESCKTCFDTYKYIDSSTANLYNHRCCRNEPTDQTSITSFIRSPRSTFSSSKTVSKKKRGTKTIMHNMDRWFNASISNSN